MYPLVIIMNWWGDRKDDYPWTNEDSWQQSEDRAKEEDQAAPTKLGMATRKQMWVANKF